ncbi:Lrp/AsnC family transcriptional regulator [Cryobacterium sp. TMT1-21]|uniref:Lrp/AsnC family transcriptional regulator n=1 Tax=Cryobacterium shii TaxID=1259235 RepID=A0AAQ2C8N9_9MICO|nr:MULTISPECIES: Lrp/AsnC family transcriptional regulator [Cryobacterium]TFC51721.1 Lrp/AsnC family transcriptional regulator [Cryobacterium shii]TFC89411.1 Lrp/AsnC family transcriptional regulator [Cryobacterium sp. TmT2-59]TFD13688.1 Lrp/AsnC family transcriptional regulator [Cryobacterium sp. TMT4-10]TFD15949.1 Lrp/AsnC family transcriptional regulator [Cryobacterium sp. TMT1-21]TFD19797.1 Lrp/AsnC family transcriptional regulator [Cryobacterium sp. TMT2-23]
MTQHPAPAASAGLDPIDRRIVAELSRDARLSTRQLAALVHVSRTAAHTRLHNLVERGVITGFGAQIDRTALGLKVTALVIVKIADVSWADIAARLSELPFVEKAMAVSGDIDIILTVSAPDHEQLSQAILRDIHSMPGVVSTRSHLILEEIAGHAPALAPDIWR